MITDVDGVLVGHTTDPEAGTGCTVVLLPPGSVGARYVAGGAPATRETDLLDPANLVSRVDAFVLAGGSAFGLDAAQGVMVWLAERGTGFAVRDVVIPIVPAAALFDLGALRRRHPSAVDGRRAAEAAATTVAEGSVGAGTGATVAKFAGADHARKGGVGSSSVAGPGGLVVGALVAANPWGEVVDADGSVLAGAPAGGPWDPGVGSSTTLAVVATNAVLDKAAASHVARMSAAGIARATRPAHTRFDGDVVFVASTGVLPDVEPSLCGALGAEAVATALRRGVRAARGLFGVPGFADD